MGILGSGKKQEFKRGMEAGARPFEDKMTQLGEQVDDVKKELSNQINNSTFAAQNRQVHLNIIGQTRKPLL